MNILAWHYNRQTNVMTVLTVGQIGDFAAYQSNGETMLFVDVIAAQGDKISRERAEKMFGEFITPDSVYRS